jgi:hypothetical protein
MLACMMFALLSLTSSFTAKKQTAVVKPSLSVSAGFGPGAHHINVYVSGATYGLTLYYTLSINDGAVILTKSEPISGEDFTIAVQSPVPAAFVDVIDFYEQ